jgi:hypothetical protein
MWRGIYGEDEKAGSRMCFHATRSLDVFRQMLGLTGHCSRLRGSSCQQ